MNNEKERQTDTRKKGKEMKERLREVMKERAIQ
jgi:hypothetical protein